MRARFPPDFVDIARAFLRTLFRRCLTLLYADEDLATVTVVTGFCGYVVPDHRLGFFITKARDLNH